MAGYLAGEPAESVVAGEPAGLVVVIGGLLVGAGVQIARGHRGAVRRRRSGGQLKGQKSGWVVRDPAIKTDSNSCKRA